MKIIILVLSANLEPYISLENTIRNTWAKEKLPEIKIFYYYGNANDKKIIGDKIYSQHPEGFCNIGYKTLDAFDLIKNFKFDYLFRTNSSSYINQRNLLNFIENKPRNNFYSGIKGIYDNHFHFCSGSGYFLSRDVFDNILALENEWNHQLIDDVAIGNIITNKLKITIDNHAKRLDLNYNSIYNYDLINQHYHIRCKIDHDRSLDSYHMNNIHTILKS